MKNKVLVDTSIWIEYFRDRAPFADFLEILIDKGAVYITGVIISEILQGAKNVNEKELLFDSIKSIPYIHTCLDDWKETGILCFKLREKGITIPLTDALIASIALRENMQIFTQDKHFSSVPGIELYNP